MTLEEQERLVLADSAKEKANSIAAAALGTCLALVLVVALVLVICKTTIGILALIGSVLLFWALPASISVHQHKLLEKGKAFQSEVIGYFGVWCALPGFIARSPAAGSSMIGLAGLYAEQGRFSWALPFARSAVWMIERSPGLPTYFKLSFRASLMRILFDAGNYAEALSLARALIRETDANHQKIVNSETVAAILSMQPLAARLLKLAGYDDESSIVWKRVCELSRVQLNENVNRIRSAHQASFLAYTAVRMHDFPIAISSSEKADNLCKSGPASKALLGCIEEHWALALLETGDLYEAERHAEKSRAYWSGFLNPTAARMAESLYIMGRAKLAYKRTSEAEEPLAKAVTIRRHRYGPNHPELAMTLQPYSECLRELGRIVEAKTVDTEIETIKAVHAKGHSST